MVLPAGAARAAGLRGVSTPFRKQAGFLDLQGLRGFPESIFGALPPVNAPAAAQPGVAGFGRPDRHVNISSHDDSSHADRRSGAGKWSFLIDTRDVLVLGLPAGSDRIDPAGRDETVRASVRWAATARLGLEHREGPVTVFINGGVAMARIINSLTDIDFNLPRNIPPHVDPDDSFYHNATRVGWVLGLGVETPVWDSWSWRLDGSYLGRGQGPSAREE